MYKWKLADLFLNDPYPLSILVDWQKYLLVFVTSAVVKITAPVKEVDKSNWWKDVLFCVGYL